MCKYLLVGFLLQVFAHLLFFPCLAQGPIDDPPRPDDVFWSRRVRIRIDLNEKVNKPLLMEDTPFDYPNDYSYAVPAQNMVRALLTGYRDLKFPGYDPEDLDEQMKFEELVKEIREIEEPATANAPVASPDQEGGYQQFSGDVVEEENSDDDPFQFDMGDFDFDMDVELEEAGEVEAPTGAQKADPLTAAYLPDDLVIPFQTVLTIIEDWQFDKNKSSMYYDGKYIVLTWVDPLGQLGQKEMVAFNYEDAMPLLDQVLIKNPNNDAEYKTAKEVLEMRRFNAFISSVSGVVVTSMTETAYRKQKLLNFEHHLWEY